jgi:acyl-CoA thioester hydrolase/thioesterase-3
LETKENAIFSTEIIVRPDDIDMNNHVHFSKYLDYFLAARFDQMGRCYKLSMKQFLEMGYNWVASNMNINYKRALLLGNTAIVKTQLDSFNGAQVRANFWIYNKATNKLIADGYGNFTLINLKNLRPTRIPQEIIDKYSI